MPDEILTIGSVGVCDELPAGRLSCGDDFVEPRITAQIIPARIQAEVAVGYAVRDHCDVFKLFERVVALAGPCVDKSFRVNEKWIETET